MCLILHKGLIYIYIGLPVLDCKFTGRPNAAALKAFNTSGFSQNLSMCLGAKQ